MSDKVNNTNESKRVFSFKKFSELSSKKGKEDVESDIPDNIDSEEKLPANPNLPIESDKISSPASTKNLKPNPELDDVDELNSEKNVEFYGKVAKLPKGTKASKGYNFLENVKVSKSSIWYLMVEKQDNELQMVKYNHKKGVDLAKFISDLKGYYMSKYERSSKTYKLIESISIGGNDKYSSISNIPIIEIEGKKLISKITEDLIKLLSK